MDAFSSVRSVRASREATRKYMTGVMKVTCPSVTVLRERNAGPVEEECECEAGKHAGDDERKQEERRNRAGPYKANTIEHDRGSCADEERDRHGGKETTIEFWTDDQSSESAKSSWYHLVLNSDRPNHRGAVVEGKEGGHKQRGVEEDEDREREQAERDMTGGGASPPYPPFQRSPAAPLIVEPSRPHEQAAARARERRGRRRRGSMPSPPQAAN